MRAAIEIRLVTAEPPDALVHEFQNFGEDVYRAVRDAVAITLLDDVDRARDRLVVRGIRPRDVGWVTDAIRGVIRRYHWQAVVRLSRVEHAAPEPGS